MNAKPDRPMLPSRFSEPLLNEEEDASPAPAGVRAYHVIFCAYGFWLPNDPRGSWSTFIASWELARFGPATTTTMRRSVAGRRHDRQARLAAKEALKYPAVSFTGEQAQTIAHGFRKQIEISKYTVYACTILPQHVHLVLARTPYRVEQAVRLLKGSASKELADSNLHPLADHPLPDKTLPSPWARKCWKVFLNTDEDIIRSICYTGDNPRKEGKKRQRWSFVVPFQPATLRE
jgi:REP element-mobilizing transposase RayT